MTPLQMMIMIAALLENKSFIGECYGSIAYFEQAGILLNDGMIKTNCLYFEYSITEKGKFWLDYVLSIPYPEETKEYKIPQFKMKE